MNVFFTIFLYFQVFLFLLLLLHTLFKKNVNITIFWVVQVNNGKKCPDSVDKIRDVSTTTIVA